MKKPKPRFRVGQVVMDKGYDPPLPRVIDSLNLQGRYLCYPNDTQRYEQIWREDELRPLTRREAGAGGKRL